MKSIVFFDAEINPENGQILDIGAVDADGRQFHAAPAGEFTAFVKESALSAVTISSALT